MTNPNTELGTDTELADLVSRVRNFDYEYATTGESMALARALKVIATDIVRRHEQVSQLQSQLEEKLALASVTAELSGVIDVIRPRTHQAPARRGWFGRNLEG